MDNLSELLMASYLVAEPEIRQRAESALKFHSENTSIFLPKLLAIISDPAIVAEKQSNLKTVTVIYLKTYINEQTSRGNISTKDLELLLQEIVGKFDINESIIPKNVKVHLCDLYKQILEDVSKISEIKDAKELTVNAFKVLVGMLEEGRTKWGLNILKKCIIHAFAWDSGIYYELLAPVLYKLVGCHIQTAKAIFALLNPPPPLKKREATPIEEAKCGESCGMLFEWVLLHKSMLSKLKKLKWKGYERICFTDKLILCLNEILCLKGGGGDMAPTQHTLINRSGVVELDNTINSLKLEGFCILNLILEYFLHGPTPVLLKNSPFFPLIQNMALYSLITVLSVTTVPLKILELQYLAVPKLESLLHEILYFLTTLIPLPDFYVLFSANKVRLIGGVVFPLLWTTGEEMEQLTESPESFLSLANDACEAQESKVCKTEAARFFDALCAHIDGSLTFAVIFCIESFRYAYKGKINEDLENSHTLKEFRDAYFLQGNSDGIMEVCVMGMSILCFHLQKRLELVRSYETLIETILPNLLGEEASLLLSCRVALSLTFYLENSFQFKPKVFESSIHFLLQSLCAPNSQKALALQAADTLASLSVEPSFIDQLLPYLDNLIQHFTKATLTNHSKYFFEMLQSILATAGNRIGEKIFPVLAALVDRVQLEVRGHGNQYPQLVSTPTVLNYGIIDNCWNVIRTIAENKQFITDFLDHFEQTLKPMFMLIAEPTKIHFDDDICMTLTSLIENSQRITPIMIELFPHLPKYYDKYQCFASLFATLNQYICVGESILAKNPNFIQLLCQLGIKGLFIRSKSEIDDNSEGALFLQLLLQTFGKGVLDSFLENIIGKTLERMIALPMDKQLQRELLGVLNGCLINNCTLAMKIFTASNHLEDLINETLNLLQPLEISNELLNSYLPAIGRERMHQLGTVDFGATYNKHPNLMSYHKKLFVISICTVLVQSEIPEIIVKRIDSILDCVISILESQEISEVRAQKKRDSAAIEKGICDLFEDSEDPDLAEDEDSFSGQDMSSPIQLPNSNIGTNQEEMKETDHIIGEEEGEDEDSLGHQNIGTNIKIDRKFGIPISNLQNTFDLTIKRMSCRLYKIDEYKYFQTVIKKLYSQNATQMEKLVSTLGASRQIVFRRIMSTLRMNIMENNRVVPRIRRIVKAKRQNTEGTIPMGADIQIDINNTSN